MEGDVSAQIAPSIFLQQSLAGRFHTAPPPPPSPVGKKRDPPWQQQSPHHSYQNPNASWNPEVWAWDSVGFTAKPSMGAQRRVRGIGDDGETSLSLKLGGGLFSEETAKRPSKKVRSGSPGSGAGSYPMCQVDDCRADLSGGKDYHRRHKVCQTHSKTTQALVGKLMQRFCQQCSRFHPLSEFDEGKRSCRRRLAGHNRRRRKTNPEDVSSRSSLPGNQDNGINGSMDIINLLAILASLQGKNAVKPPNIQSLPDRDHLLQILSKINTLTTAKSSARSCSFDLNVTDSSQPSPLDNPSKGNINSTTSTMDLIAAVSAALAKSSPATDNSGDDKTNMPSINYSVDANLHKESTQILPSLGVGSGSCTTQSQAEVFETIEVPRLRTPLQLFGSGDDDSPPKLGSSVKYLSSESSNPMDDRSFPSSPPIAQELFPVHSATVRKYDNHTVEASTSSGWSKPFDLFKVSETQVESGAVQNIRYQPGYNSSGSDQSPSSLNSDAQDRTGRIMFKLFDKDPSNLPGTLRSQIHSWLSNSPSEMESYIRPGCVILSIYLSMPSSEWDELEDELLQRVTNLVQCSDSDFWRNGRFLVRTTKQLASHKNGKICISKSWRAWSAPGLTSMSPVAVVGGQETLLVLRGCNLTVPGTKIHCTYMGGYTSKEVLGSTYPGTIYDDSCLENFVFPGGAPHVLGRCFIEVENGFKGNSFPLIIADANIVQELRALETEFEEVSRTADDLAQNNGRPRSREDALHFLNELGWLFQKATKTPSNLHLADFSIARFKFLFTFSVERDWPALIKTLLDILAQRTLASEDLSKKALTMLSDVHLLNRAVKRRCREMVDLLLHYYVKRGSDGPKLYLFTPNMAGPGGVTSLHLAASTQGSEDMVDALTNDPEEIGLNCWNFVTDDSGQSPFMYAASRNNHSYNELVDRKLEDRKNARVCITVRNEEIPTDMPLVTREPDKPARSCAQCAKMEVGRIRHPVRTRGLLHRPYVHSMLGIAAVCVCVCLFFRGLPKVGSVALFKWENLDFGPS